MKNKSVITGKTGFYILLIGILLVVTDLSAQVKQIVVWDGETATSAAGWANPASTCSIRSQTNESHSGSSAVEFKFFDGGSNEWLGAGWDWVSFQVGEYGTDITAMKNYTFWLKVTGTVAEFSFNLLCNGAPALDQPQHHTEKVVVSKYCKEWKDGQWHQIIVPLEDLKQPEGFDAKHVAEMQFFNTGKGNGSFFIDDLAFNNSSITTSNRKMPQTENGNSLMIFPNPVNSYFRVNYSLNDLSPVEFILYDMKGNLVEKQKMENMQSHSGEFIWPVNNQLISGEYFIRLHQRGIKLAECMVIKL